MADQNQLQIQLGVEISKAVTAIQSFEKFAEQALGEVKAANDTLNASFGTLKTVAEAAIAAFAIDKIASYFKDSINLAAEQQSTLVTLNQAMANTGEYSIAASADMKAFADQIQATTTFSNQTILSQLAVAKGFGVTNDRAKELVEGAVQLTAAMNGKYSLNESLLLIQKTLSGTLVRLGEQFPALKQFSAEQLQGGAAARFFAEGLAGTAEKLATTYSGSLAQASNAHADFKRSLGDLVTDNPVVVEALHGITTIFQDLRGLVQGNHAELESFVSGGIKFMAAQVPTATNVMQALTFALEGLADGGGHAVADFLEIFAAAFETIYAVAGPAIDIILRLEATVVDLAAAIPGASDAASAMGVNLHDLSAQMDKNREGFEQLADSADSSIRGMSDKVRADTDKMVAGFDGFNSGMQHVEDTVNDVAKKIIAADSAGSVSAEESYKNRSGYTNQAITDLKALEAEQKAAAELEKRLNQEQLNQISPADKAVAEWKNALAEIDTYVHDGVMSWQEGEEDKAKATSIYVDKISKLNEQLADESASYLDGLQKQSATDLGKIDIEYDEALDKLKKMEDRGILSHQQAADARLAIDQDYITKRTTLFSQNPADIFEKVVNPDPKHPLTSTDAVAASLGGLNDALQGAQGAANLIAQSAGTLVNTFLPGLGSVVTSIVGVLEQGPDATKQFIEQFIQAIPQIMEAVSEAMPEVVDGFVDAMVNKGGAAKIALATVEAMFGVPEMRQIGKDWGVNFGDSLNSPNFSRTVHGWFSGVEENFGKASAANIDAALKKDGTAVSDGIKSGFETVKADVPELVAKIRDGLVEGLNDLLSGMRQLPKEISKEAFVSLPVAIRKGFLEGLGDIKAAEAKLLHDITVEIPAEIKKGFDFGVAEVRQGFNAARVDLERFFGVELPGAVGHAFQSSFGEMKSILLVDAPKALEAAGGEVAADLKGAGGAVAQSIKSGVGGVVSGIKDELGGVLTPLRTALGSFKFPEIPTPPWLKEFEDAIHNLTNWQIPGVGGGGGGGNPVTNLFTKGHFATGLDLVPSGFPNDSFGPVSLQTGEGVLDAGTNSNVREMAASYKTDQASTLALLSKLVDLLGQTQMAPVEIKVGNDTLAKAILKLNRTNARLTA